ncbi:MAG: hypothetical protein ACYCOO_02930 [Chitinophagaceae bacterium]
MYILVYIIYWVIAGLQNYDFFLNALSIRKLRGNCQQKEDKKNIDLTKSKINLLLTNCGKQIKIPEGLKIIFVHLRYQQIKLPLNIYDEKLEGK